MQQVFVSYVDENYYKLVVFLYFRFVDVDFNTLDLNFNLQTCVWNAALTKLYLFYHYNHQNY